MTTSKAQLEAKSLIDQGYKIIPLIENEKGNYDKRNSNERVLVR